MKQVKKFFFVFLMLLIIGITFFFSNIYSITGTTETFSNCKFIKPNNVCNKYTECVYDELRDISCIKGYLDKSPDLSNPLYAEPIIQVIEQ